MYIQSRMSNTFSALFPETITIWTTKAIARFTSWSSAVVCWVKSGYHLVFEI